MTTISVCRIDYKQLYIYICNKIRKKNILCRLSRNCDVKEGIHVASLTFSDVNTTYYVAFMQLRDIKSGIHVESVSLSDKYATFHVAFWLTSDIKGCIHVTKRDTSDVNTIFYVALVHESDMKGVIHVAIS